MGLPNVDIDINAPKIGVGIYIKGPKIGGYLLHFLLIFFLLLFNPMMNLNTGNTIKSEPKYDE